MKEGRKGEAGGEGTSRREEGEKERQTERKREIVGNVYVWEVEKTPYSLTSIYDSTFLYQNFE